MSTDYAAAIEHQNFGGGWEFLVGFVWLWDPRLFYPSLVDCSVEDRVGENTREFFEEHKATAGRLDIETTVQRVWAGDYERLLRLTEIPPDWKAALRCAETMLGRYGETRFLWWAS